MQPLFQIFLKKVFRESGKASYPPSSKPERVTWPGPRPESHKPGRLFFHFTHRRNAACPVWVARPEGHKPERLFFHFTHRRNSACPVWVARPESYKPGWCFVLFRRVRERVLSHPGHRTKKQPSYWTTALCVGENLFFRAVTSQVSSAPASLTSVFGMGTGGPSRQSTPTIQFAVSLDGFTIIPQRFSKCKLFLKKFQKILENSFCQEKHGENTENSLFTSRPARPAAWRPALFAADPGILFPRNAPDLPCLSGR